MDIKIIIAHCCKRTENAELKLKHEPAGFYLQGGGRGEASQTSQLPLPQKKFFLKKKLKLFQILILFDDGIKESVKVTKCPEIRFQPILNTIFSKFSGGAPPNP